MPSVAEKVGLPSLLNHGNQVFATETFQGVNGLPSIYMQNFFYQERKTYNLKKPTKASGRPT